MVAVICAVVTFLGTLYFPTPQYESTAVCCVNNSLLVDEALFSLLSGKCEGGYLEAVRRSAARQTAEKTKTERQDRQNTGNLA